MDTYKCDQGLSPDQQDALQEMINIGVGKAADSLSRLVESRIILCVPKLAVLTAQKLEEFRIERLGEEGKVISQQFDGQVSGKACLMFDKQSAILLASLLAGEEYPYDELDVELEGILLEVGNILLNGVAGALSNLISDQLDYSVPEIDGLTSLSRLLISETGNDSKFVICDVHLQMQTEKVDGAILLAFNLQELGNLLEQLLASPQ